MNITEGIADVRESSWGCFAVVCYLQEPQRSFLHSLREMIPGQSLPPAHITFLPPRPLSIPIKEACKEVEKLAHKFSAFEAELSDVRHFSESNFLYLSVSAGGQTISEIHQRLNAGKLNFPEAYEFLAHLTLGGPIPTATLEAAQLRMAENWMLSECPRRLAIDELVCLWMDPDATGKEWVRYKTFALRNETLPLVAIATT